MILFRILILLLILSACNDKNSDKLIVGTSADYPPFEFVREGKFAGFDIDIANALGKEMGKKIEIIDMDFASLIPALSNNQIDLAISSLTITPERVKNVDFSDIYYQGSYGIIYKGKDNSWQDKKIGVQLGSVWEVLANEKKEVYPNIQIHPLARINNLVEELKLDRIDMVILDSEQAYNYAIENNLNYTIEKELGSGLAIAMKKDSNLKNEINQALEFVKINKIDELKIKWFKVE